MSGTVDLATLAIAIDSTQARVAALELDKLTAASKKTEDQSKKTATATQELMGGWSRMKGAIQAVGAAIAVVEGALAVWLFKVNESMAAMKDLAIQAGTTAAALSKFELPAKLAGSGVESVSHSMFRLSKALAEAEDPMSSAAQALKAIGITSDMIKGKKLEDVYVLLAKRLNEYSEGVGKNVVMQELLSRAGYEQSKVLKEVAEASKLTTTVTNEQAEAADKLGDTWTEIVHTLNQAKRETLAEYSPMLQRISDDVKQAAKEHGLFSAVITLLGQSFVEFFGIIDRREELEAYNDEIRETIKVVDRLTAAHQRAAEGGWFMKLFGRAADDIKKELEDAKAYLAALQEYRRSLVTPEKKEPEKPQVQAPNAEALKKYMKDIEESKKTYDAIMNKAGGLEADYADKVEDLIFLWHEGEISIEKFQEALRTYASQQPGVIELEKARKAALDDEIKAMQEWVKTREEMDKVVRNFKADLAADLSDLKFETELLGMNNDDRQKAIALRKIELDLRRAIAALPQLPEDATAQQYTDYQNAVEKLQSAAAVAAQITPHMVAQYQVAQQQLQLWNELANVTQNFFTDLLENGKSAFGNLWNYIKRFFAQMAAMFATKMILQVGASALGGSAGQALASTAGSFGQNSVAGTVGSAILGGVGEFSSALAGTFVGPIAPGFSAAGLGNSIATAIGAIPVWGQIALAVAAIAAYISSLHKGGPKYEGQATGHYDEHGNFISDAGRNFNVVGTQANQDAAKFNDGLAKAIVQALTSVGGKLPGGFDVGSAIVRDPAGTAQTFVDTILKDASGKVLFQQHNASVGRSDEDLQKELELQSQRAILAALQASELPYRIAHFFDGLDPQTATAAEISAAMEQATAAQQAFAQQWQHFNDLFMTDAERLQQAQDAVAKTFADLGLAVPKDNAAFAALVRGIDGTTKEGAELIDKLLGVQDAFFYVQSAAEAAAEAMEERWKQVVEAVNTITGRQGGGLEDMVKQFQALHTQFAGLTSAQLGGVLSTITKEDFANYDETSQKLIVAILQMVAAAKENSDSVDANTQVSWTQYQQLVGQAQDAAKSWYSALQSTFGGASFSSRTGTTINALNQQIGNTQGALDSSIYQWFASYGTSKAQVDALLAQYRQWQPNYSLTDLYNSSYNPKSGSIDGMIKQLEIYKKYLAENTDDLARYWELENQYAGHGEQLLALDKWYEQQKALIGDNSVALTALAEEYQRQFAEIIANGADNTADELQRLKDSIAEWLRGLDLSNLSPLSPWARLDAAQSSYVENLLKAQGGDQNALSNFVSLAEQYLREAGSYYGTSSAEYQAIYQALKSQAQEIAGLDAANRPLTAADATQNTAAITNELTMLRDQVVTLEASIAALSATIQQTSAQEVQAVEEQTDALTAAITNDTDQTVRY